MKKSIYSYKYKLLKYYLVIFTSIFLFGLKSHAQGFVDLLTIDTVVARETTNHKPQSKVWNHGGYWWAVIPIKDDVSGNGSYLWRLDGTSWTKLWNLALDFSADIFPDTKRSGDVTHILLQKTNSTIQEARLVSIEFVPGSPPTYQLWSQRSTTIQINLDANLECATIDIDSQGRMWLASDDATDINIRWSDSPYSVWNGPVTIGTAGNTDDDICAVTAFDGNKVGVLWSNQTAKEFRFRYHTDGDDPATWSTMEVAASGSAGGGVADDHINLAVGTDGTIYSAVKTSYELVSQPTIALLEREPNTGNWNFYGVNNINSRSRPIALLDEDDEIIYILYTVTNGGKIFYNYSSINSLNFSSAEDTLQNVPEGENLTSTKENFTSEVVVLYDLDALPGANLVGVILGTEPLPVELASFDALTLEDRIVLNWRTETEINNYGFEVERLRWNSDWEKLGFVEGYGNSNSPKEYSFTDYDIYLAGLYKYRLKQIDNDGKFEYSHTISVNVGRPSSFYLSQNFPNPFNPSTKVEYSIPHASKVSLKIYDILGREVAKLVDDYKEAGTYSVTFDASNLAGGIYVYIISAGNFVENKKMSLVK